MQVRQRSFQLAALLIALASLALLLVRSRPSRGLGPIEPLLFSSGLDQPRGLTFSPDGTLYVAEAGYAAFGQEPRAGKISAVSPSGGRAVIVDGLPPAQADQPLFAQSGLSGLSRGPGAGDTALFVLSGPTAQSQLGAVWRAAPVPGEPLWRLEQVASFDQALTASTTPSAPWGASVTREGLLHLTLPAANQLLRVRPSSVAGGSPVQVASVTGFIDSGQRNPQPVGAAVAPDGSVYVALFGAEPLRPGSGRVVRVDAAGRWQPIFEALTFPIALAFAPDGQLYVLELATDFNGRTGRFTPNSGRLVALGPSPSRRRTAVVGVNYPTALAFSPSGDAYVAESGVFSRVGEGRVLRVVSQSLRALS